MPWAPGSRRRALEPASAARAQRLSTSVTKRMFFPPRLNPGCVTQQAQGLSSAGLGSAGLGESSGRGEIAAAGIFGKPHAPSRPLLPTAPKAQSRGPGCTPHPRKPSALQEDAEPAALQEGRCKKHISHPKTSEPGGAVLPGVSLHASGEATLPPCCLLPRLCLVPAP